MEELYVCIDQWTPRQHWRTACEALENGDPAVATAHATTGILSLLIGAAEQLTNISKEK